uniref:hypothetical protein n=1 Tax=Candidatus Electrothrix sp. TaxID=2170559 RepID=UPI0040564D7F
MSICIIDTSIFCNILKVPGKSQDHSSIMDLMKEKIQGGESLLLPMTAIIETGNHIAQNGDGRQRRSCAERFIKQLQGAIAGEAPWTPMKPFEMEIFSHWLGEFPDYAMKGVGFGDLSIIKNWEELQRIHSGQRVYIWT